MTHHHRRRHHKPHHQPNHKPQQRKSEPASSSGMIHSMLNGLSAVATRTGQVISAAATQAQAAPSLLVASAMTLLTQPATANEVTLQSAQEMNVTFSDHQNIYGLFSNQREFFWVVDNIKRNVVNECGMEMLNAPSDAILQVITRLIHHDQTFLILCRDLASDFNQTTFNCIHDLLIKGLQQFQDYQNGNVPCPNFGPINITSAVMGCVLVCGIIYGIGAAIKSCIHEVDETFGVSNWRIPRIA